MTQPDLTGLTSKDRFCQSVERSLGIVLIKTCREIEGKYIDSLSSLFKKESVPVGTLVKDPTYDDKQLDKFIKWLDSKEKDSVVFVSFGTEYFMSKEEILEVAYGLELSKVNFIWAIRFHEGEKTRVDEVLPKGFLERSGEWGIVVENWEPQGNILGHCSTGGLVSHCGWSSMMEGIKYGVPIVAMPLQLDQPLNARLAVELGVGMEVDRDEDGDGRFFRGEIAKTINKVVVEEVGEGVRRRVKEVSEKTGRGDEEMDTVVEKLLNLCEKCEKKSEKSEKLEEIENDIREQSCQN